MRVKWVIWSVVGLFIACGTSAGGQYATPDSGAVEDTSVPVDIVAEVQVDLAVADVVAEAVPMPDLIPGEVTDEEWALLFGEECPTADLVGLVKVHFDQGGVWQYVDGRIQDRVKAVNAFAELDVVGDCRLFLREAPQCVPECNGQKEQCSLGEVCEPLDQLQDVGPLYVVGLNYDVVVMPNNQNDYAMFTNEEKGVFQDGPIFDEGDFVAAHAGQGMYGPFTLQGRGVAPLAMLAPPVVLIPGSDLELDWETSSGPGEILVQVSLQNHATTPVTILCRTEDSGALSVPAKFVDKLLEAYIAGDIALTVQRRTVDAENFKTGCIEFQVYSDYDVKLKLPVE